MKGKRGPVPRGAYHNKTRVLSTRIREDTRTLLEQAAAESGKSLSQEIEHRLRRSFDQDDRLIITYGSRRNYAIFRMIANMMVLFSDSTRADGDWIDSPVAFQQLVRAVNTVLEALEPDAPKDESFRSAEQESSSMPGWGIAAAAALLGRVRNADPTLPALSSTNDPYPFIRADLGHVAERLGEPGREVSISEIIDLLKQLLAQSDPEHPLLSQAPAHAQVDDPGKARGDGQ